MERCIHLLSDRNLRVRLKVSEQCFKGQVVPMEGLIASSRCTQWHVGLPAVSRLVLPYAYSGQAIQVSARKGREFSESSLC